MPACGEARAVEGDGEAEVADAGDAVFGEPDVAGLEVAVDDAAAVGLLEPRQTWPAISDGVFERQAVVLGACDEVVDGAAGHVLGDDAGLRHPLR